MRFSLCKNRAWCSFITNLNLVKACISFRRTNLYKRTSRITSQDVEKRTPLFHKISRQKILTPLSISPIDMQQFFQTECVIVCILYVISSLRNDLDKSAYKLYYHPIIRSSFHTLDLHSIFINILFSPVYTFCWATLLASASWAQHLTRIVIDREIFDFIRLHLLSFIYKSQKTKILRDQTISFVVTWT